MIALALLAVALPVLLPLSVPPVSTMLNQSCAVLGVLVWLLAAGSAGARCGALAFGAMAPLIGAVALAVLGQWLTDAPMGQRWSPVAALGLAAVAALAAAGDGEAARGRMLGKPLLVALTVAALLSTLVSVVQVFAPQWADGHLIAFPTAPGRAVGNMRQPNQLSTVLVWGCGAVVALGLLRQWGTGWIGAALALLTGAVVLSASRTGMVGIGMLALWGLIDRRLPSNVRVLMVLTLPLYFAGWWGMEQWSAHTGDFFYGDDQIKKTFHGDPSSSRGRIWANTLSLIAAHPWTGVGAGRFNFAWSMTPFPNRPVAFFDHSHNLPLQLAVESGVPFALAVLALLAWAFWRARGALFVPNDREAIVARSLAFMLAVIAVHSLLEYPLWYTYFLFPTALMAGSLCGAAQRTQSAAGPAGLRLPPRGMMALCALGLVGMGWVARQYYEVAVIFDPSLSIGEAAPLDERIRTGQQSVLFGHHADYAKVTMSEHPEQEAAAFRRTVYHLLDTRLMIAYAKALAARGQEAQARHVAARLREFRNPASDSFFAPCRGSAASGAPLPFQCGPDPQLSADAVRPEVVFRQSSARR